MTKEIRKKITKHPSVCAPTAFRKDYVDLMFALC